MGKKNIKQNEICWVDGCNNKKLEAWLICQKHFRMQMKGHWIKMKTIGIKGFDNTPTKV